MSSNNWLKKRKWREIQPGQNTGFRPDVQIFVRTSMKKGSSSGRKDLRPDEHQRIKRVAMLVTLKLSGNLQNTKIASPKGQKESPHSQGDTRTHPPSLRTPCTMHARERHDKMEKDTITKMRRYACVTCSMHGLYPTRTYGSNPKGTVRVSEPLLTRDWGLQLTREGSSRCSVLG